MLSYNLSMLGKYCIPTNEKSKPEVFFNSFPFYCILNW